MSPKFHIFKINRIILNFVCSSDFSHSKTNTTLNEVVPIPVLKHVTVPV
jgi:hypothetical protein